MSDLLTEDDNEFLISLLFPSLNSTPPPEQFIVNDANVTLTNDSGVDLVG